MESIIPQFSGLTTLGLYDSIFFVMKLKTLFVLSALLFVMPASVNAGGAVPPANIKIEKAECGQPYKDSATVWFSWESRADALSYRFYGKTVNDPEYKFYGEIKENNYKMIIKPQFDYYVAVSAVYKYLDETPGTVESRKSDQFLLAGENLLSACRKNKTPKKPTLWMMSRNMVMSSLLLFAAYVNSKRNFCKFATE